MNKRLFAFLAMVFVVAIGVAFLTIGCSGKVKPQHEVYVPKQWISSDCIRELRQVWFVTLSSEDVLDTERMKQLVKVLWTAEANGMTFDEIEQELGGKTAMKTRTMTDILTNGL